MATTIVVKNHSKEIKIKKRKPKIRFSDEYIKSINRHFRKETKMTKRIFTPKSLYISR